MEWRGWIGKYIFLRTKGGRVYSGTVKNVDQDSQITFLEIIDKFDSRVMFAVSEIIEIKEEYPMTQ